METVVDKRNKVSLSFVFKCHTLFWVFYLDKYSKSECVLCVCVCVCVRERERERERVTCRCVDWP